MSAPTTDDTFSDPEAVALNINTLAEWKTVNGHELYTVTYKATTQPPVATLTMLHGVGEHIERYKPLMRHLASKGINVLGFDQRGYGRTGRKKGPLGHSEGWKVLHADITAAIRAVHIEGVPQFLFGHSMGGANALNYTALTAPTDAPLAGVIASAPALVQDPSIAPNPILAAAAPIVAKLLPTMPFSINIAPEGLHRDPKALEEFKASYYNYDIASARTLADLLGAAKALVGHERPARIRIPILVVHGDEDPVVSPKGSKKFTQRAVNSGDVTLKLLPGELHEPHVDFNKETLFPIYSSWILDHVKPKEAAADADVVVDVTEIDVSAVTTEPEIPAATTDATPEVKADLIPEIKADEVTADPTPEVKDDEVKTDPTPEVKADEAKADPTPEVKTDATTETIPAH